MYIIIIVRVNYMTVPAWQNDIVILPLAGHTRWNCHIMNEWKGYHIPSSCGIVNNAYGKRSSILCVHSLLASGASIADSEMDSTLDLDSRRMAGETYSTRAQCGSIAIVVRAHIESIRAIFSTGWLYLYNGITSAKKFDQPHLSENVARSL